jgi:DNA topoisomerase VI subunit B
LNARIIHGEDITWQRISKQLPPLPEEIKPQLQGVEPGRLIQMLNLTHRRHLLLFLQN